MCKIQHSPSNATQPKTADVRQVKWRGMSTWLVCVWYLSSVANLIVTWLSQKRVTREVGVRDDSEMRRRSQMASLIVCVVATYLTSVVDRMAGLCSRDCQGIAPLPSISEGEGEVSGLGQVAKDLLSCLPVDAAGVVEKT